MVLSPDLIANGSTGLLVAGTGLSTEGSNPSLYAINSFVEVYGIESSIKKSDSTTPVVLPILLNVSHNPIIAPSRVCAREKILLLAQIILGPLKEFQYKVDAEIIKDNTATNSDALLRSLLSVKVFTRSYLFCT